MEWEIIMEKPAFGRCVPMEGAPNFRDLGGYVGEGGRRVRWGVVYRSDDLNDLTDGDVGILEGLGIRTVVDFRTGHEAESWPDRVPAGVGGSINIPIDAGRVMGRFREGDLTVRKTMGIMVSVYRDLVNEHQGAYRRFFELLGDGSRLPLLFHCTAGKDRTGFGAAMFLSALGVDRETVMGDYLFSGECLQRRYREGVDYSEALRPLYGVEPEFLGAAFEVIDHKYGGVEGYLADCLGVDLGKFRGMYLEDAAEGV